MKVIEGTKYFTISEVANLINVTRCTILRWYEYESNTDTKYLPEFITLGKNNARYWKEEDLFKFKEFKAHLSVGDMAQVSKKYNGTNKTVK